MSTINKCGSVALLGEPNAGKSSLINALVGCKVAITAPMAGTTRDAIRGILNTANSQIIFVDTPGMQRATNLLEHKMNRAISGAVKSADVICFVLDVNHVTDKVLSKLANYRDFGVPVIVVVSKIDSAKPEKLFRVLDQIKQYDFVKEFVPVSSVKKIGLEELLQCLEKYIPAGKPIYENEIYTDTSERTMAAEIIREAIINQLRDEVPTGVKVVITKFETVERTINIDADIVCDKPNHKKIIIGNQGKLIRAVGITARKKLEELLGQHVMLHTFVIVREGWRDQTQWL
ncbi:MAG: GTPase Era [Eubacteriales bacterium]|nr:GTPase Era [Eubacteriales bacterium]